MVSTSSRIKLFAPASHAAGAMTDDASRPRPAKIPPRRRPPGRPRRDEAGSTHRTRELLLDAAIKLFAHHGYDPVTTGAVAEAAGLSQSMVHYHFGSKSNLWEQAIRRMMKRRGALFRAAARDLAGLGPLDKLKALIRRLIEANARNPDFVRIAVHEGTVRSPRLTWLVENYFAAGYHVFDDVVREAIAAKAIPDLPVHDVTNVITSAASLTFGLKAMVEDIYDIDLRDPVRIASFADTVIRIIFDGILKAPASAPQAQPNATRRPSRRARRPNEEGKR
jgi:AcrR family transcriptional regulator